MDPGTLYCQACDAANAADEEYCARCGSRLMVVSGAVDEEEADELSRELAGGGEAGESMSFDEHLLERISLLEEAVKRTAESVGRLVDAVRRQERAGMLAQAGLDALRELLERDGALRGDEWRRRCAQLLDRQMGLAEKRQRFAEVRESALALDRSDDRIAFRGRLEVADAALAAGELEAAIEAMEEAVAHDPGNYPLVHFLAQCLFDEGDRDAALDAFGRVLEEEPGHAEALVWAGVIHHQRGESERAGELLARAAELAPGSFIAQFSRGAVLAERGETEAAAEALARAVEIDPLPQALLALGRCEVDLGRSGRAVRHLEKAVEGDPELHEGFLLLGMSHLATGEEEAARAALERASELGGREETFGRRMTELTKDGRRLLEDLLERRRKGGR